MTDRKDPKLDKKHQQILSDQLHRPENRFCADCGAQAPRWASTNLGVFLCIRCSGIHRNLGVHISTVRSTTLDTWTPKQIADIQTRGNEWGRRRYEAILPPGFVRPDPNDNRAIEQWIRDKYEKKVFMREEDGGCGGVLPKRRQAPSLAHPAPVGSMPIGGGENASVRKLTDMGFDPSEAAACLARCDGNEAGAIEMLLANPNHKTHVPESSWREKPVDPPRPAQPPPRAVPQEIDLIDFGFNDAPASHRSAPHPAPAIVPAPIRTPITNGGPLASSSGAAASDGHIDEFADFSAFESAAETSAPTNSVQQPVTKTHAEVDLLSTITSLYASTPAKAPAGAHQPAFLPQSRVSAESEEDAWWASDSNASTKHKTPTTTIAPEARAAMTAATNTAGPDAFDSLFGTANTSDLSSMFSTLSTKKH